MGVDDVVPPVVNTRENIHIGKMKLQKLNMTTRNGRITNPLGTPVVESHKNVTGFDTNKVSDPKPRGKFET